MQDTATGLRVRPLQPEDEPYWRQLWTAYLDFYRTSVAEPVYESTFARLLDPGQPEMAAFMALGAPAPEASPDTTSGVTPDVTPDVTPVGLVHYIQHRHCWRLEDVIYLQDLYVDPARRGTGAGRALIEAVYAEADRRGCPGVYWMTQDFNQTARLLYDRLATLTPFVKYQR